MKVTLAYPYDGHDPDETVDLDDAVARGLVRDGLARLPDLTTAATLDDLRTYAATNAINIAGLTRKADISAAIEAAESTPDNEGA